jgi:hypothetical protein
MKAVQTGALLARLVAFCLSQPLKGSQTASSRHVALKLASAGPLSHDRDRFVVRGENRRPQFDLAQSV